MRAQALFGDLGAPRQHDFLRAHVGRHDPDQIVRTQDAIDQADQRLGDRVRRLERHVGLIQEYYEHAVARVLGGLEHLALRRGLHPLALRSSRGPHHDVLEGVHFLPDAVFLDSEVPGLQIQHRLAVVGRIDVHPNEVRLASEGRRTLLTRGARRRWRRGCRGGRLPTGLRRGGLRSGPDGQAHKDDDDGGSESSRSAHVTS